MASVKLKEHPQTHQPNQAILTISAGDVDYIKRVDTMEPGIPKPANHIRIVCISDTHTKTNNLELPNGDILIHSGDFSMTGTVKEIEDFATFINQQPHPHKVVIAGNHEISFDYYDGGLDQASATRLMGESNLVQMAARLEELHLNHPRQLLPSNITYLKDSSVTLCGYKIWGSPWTPRYRSWAYNANRGDELLEKWNLIPQDTDIVITHGPPVGVGDQTLPYNDHVGCVELFSTINRRVKPVVHVFGHVHEGYGQYKVKEELTKYINASICNSRYELVNSPICIDLVARP